MNETTHTARADDDPGSAERLTVIIPCYNEEENVRAAVADVLREAPRIPMPVRVVLADDGSTDRTREVMHDIVAEHPDWSVLENPENLGLGGTVLAAYDLVQPGSWVTVLPGDNEIRFSSIHRLLAVRRDYDVVLGYLHNPIIRPLTRRLASASFAAVVNALYGYQFKYLNGLKLYRLEAFQGIEVHSQGHAFNAELLAKAILRNPALRIGEAPFVARGRATGNSKAIRPGSIIRAVSDVLRGHQSVLRFRERVIRSPDE